MISDLPDLVKVSVLTNNVVIVEWNTVPKESLSPHAKSFETAKTTSRQYTRTIKHRIKNERWSLVDDFFSAEFFLYANFFFGEDGTFSYTGGHSSGTYSRHYCEGTYNYDLETNEIKFNVLASHANGIPRIEKANCPSIIKIKEFTDSIVVLEDRSCDRTFERRTNQKKDF